MNPLIGYIDFILESSNSGKIIYSSDFRTLLKLVSDKTAHNSLNSVVNIARLLLSIESVSEDTYTLIDITDKNDTISMLSVSRINRSIATDPDILSFIDFIPQNMRTNHIISHAHGNNGNIDWINKLWKNQRTDVKVGRYAKRVLVSVSKQSIRDSDIEIFVNLYKSSFDYKKGLSDKLELVKGDEIKKYYSEEIYENGGGSLNNSCMRYSKCQSYFDIYTKNPEVCQLLILKNENGKLIGRSLIWKLTDGRTFMDRIYTTNDSDSNIFKDYAKEKGWANYYNRNGRLEVQLKRETYNKYPYMDTFCSFNKEDFLLVNDEIRDSSDWYILQNTDGSYSEGGGVWSEYSQEYINEEEAIWCENIDSYVYQDDAIWLEYRSEWAGPSDGIVWSEYEQENFYRDDACHSSCMDSWLERDNSIEIIVDSSGKTDFCTPKRKDIYLEINGKFYFRKTYIKSPFSGKYIFYDKISDKVKKKVKEDTGDSGNGVKARERIISISSNIISKGFSDKAIEKVEESDSYQNLKTWWRRFMRERDERNLPTLLAPKEVLYYILYWSITENQIDQNKWTSSSTYMNAYEGTISLIPDGETKLRYKNCVLRPNTNDISSEKVRQLLVVLTDIASEFDYSIFGAEFQMIYLYLTI